MDYSAIKEQVIIYVRANGMISEDKFKVG